MLLHIPNLGYFTVEGYIRGNLMFFFRVCIFTTLPPFCGIFALRNHIKWLESIKIAVKVNKRLKM